MLLQNKTYLIASFLLLLNTIIWKCSRATTTVINGAEIGMQPLFDNIEKFTDNIVITEWLNRDDQKHDNELVRRSRAIGYPRSAGISPYSTYSQDAVYRGINAAGMNAAQSRSGSNGMRPHATQIGAYPRIDFNPVLLRGYRGLPGARIRINKRAFEYFSSLARYVLDEQIPLIKIPDINQKIEQVSAEVTVCNIFVSNYRSPQCLDIYPAAPNIIVFSIQDLDVGLTANLDAKAKILLIPLSLSGVVHANIYHASATITLGIVRTPFGTPQLFLVGCDIKIPYADVCIRGGGFLGQLINTFFRQELSAQVRKMIPERACKALPDIINQRVNPMLARFPQSIPFSQLSSTLFAGLLGGGTPPIPPHCYSPQCQARFMMTTKAPTTRLPSTRNDSNAVPPRNPPSPMFNQSTNRVTNSRNNNNIKSAASVPIHTAIPGTQSKIQINVEKKGKWENYVGSEIPAEMNIKDKNQKYAKSFTNTELMAQSFNQPVQKLNPLSSSSYARAKREIVGFENLSSNIPNNITIKSGTATIQSPQTVILQLPPKILQPLRKSQQKPNANLKFIDGKNSAMPTRPSTTAQKLSTHAPTLPKHSSKATAFSGPRTAVSDKFNRSAIHGVQGVQVRHPGVYQPGHPGGYQPGHPGGYQAGHPGVYQPGHPGGYQPGYQSRVNQAVGVGPAGSSDPCAGCPPITGGAMAGIGSLLTQQLDLGRVANLVLTTQLLHIYATPYDFNLDLNGEFSPYGFGGTPFGPFPIQWPTAQGLPMLEIMIGDFAINSLFYWLHRANFIAFRIGPEIPGIGALLTTTCETTDDYTEEEFEDEENEELLMRLLRLSQRRRRFRLHHQRRSKRQQNGNGDMGGGLGDLAGLGICIGDIAPAIKEEYPNRTLALILHTARAPSLTIHRRATTFAQLDLMLFVDIYLDQTTTRVGTITVTIVMDIMIQIMGNRIIGNATLPVLSLMDRDKTLGLEQDTFDNLASLAKDMFLKAVNDRISKGIEIPFPTMANLPVIIMNPQIHILEHAIYIAADFVVSPSTLQMLSFSALTMGSQNPQR